MEIKAKDVKVGMILDMDEGGCEEDVTKEELRFREGRGMVLITEVWDWEYVDVFGGREKRWMSGFVGVMVEWEGEVVEGGGWEWELCEVEDWMRFEKVEKVA